MKQIIKRKIIIKQKMAIVVVEEPASINPQGKTDKYEVELEDGETLEQLKKRWQKKIGPKEWGWITKNGIHKLVCTNIDEIPTVEDVYYSREVDKEIEIEEEIDVDPDQISIFDYLTGKIKL